MARPFVDLHTHSLASDGTDRPAELVRKAAAKGLAAVALTDHDTIGGLDEAEKAAEACGMRFIRGVEIAVKYGPGELHIVGLWMPQPSQRMLDALALLQKNRRERNARMLEVLNKRGMSITIDEVRAVSGGGAVGRPHIALALKNKGYVLSRREAFERHIGMEGGAYVPRELMSPEEGIGLLRDEGAVVVLAHPCLSGHMSRQRLDEVLGEFKQYGLHALEAYHSTHSQDKVRICVDLAAKHGLLLSGGTDYHGLNKEGIELGTGCRGNVRVPLFILEKLEQFHFEKAACNGVP